MYPRVKVRNQEPDDHEMSHLQTPDPFDSISIHNSCSQVKEFQDDSPSCVIRVPKSYISIGVMPLIPEFKGTEKNEQKVDGGDKPNIRVGSIPRPRAVLSSPHNDEIIGNKSKIKAGQTSALKSHNIVHNRHAQAHCTVKATHASTENPISTRKSIKAVDGKSDFKGKGSGKAVPSHRAQLGTRKPSSMRI